MLHLSLKREASQLSYVVSAVLVMENGVHPDWAFSGIHTTEGS